MEPVTIALGLAKVIPSIIGLFKGDGEKDKATQVQDIAKQVTRVSDAWEAVAAIECDPAMLLEFKCKLLDYAITMREPDLKEQAEHHRYTAEMEGTVGDLPALPVFHQFLDFKRPSHYV